MTVLDNAGSRERLDLKNSGLEASMRRWIDKISVLETSQIASSHGDVREHVRSVRRDDAHHTRRHLLLAAQRVREQNGRAVERLGLHRLACETLLLLMHVRHFCY